MQVDKTVTTSKILSHQSHVTKLRIDLVRKFHTKIVALLLSRQIQLQPTSHLSDTHTLNDKRKKSNEKHNIENLLRPVHLSNNRISGKDDRHSTTQTHPRHKQTSPVGHLLKRQQTSKHTYRTGKDNHEQSHKNSNKSHIQQLMRIDKQTQSDEHDNLEQPRQTIHESVDLLPEHQLSVTNNKTANIHSQITVAVNRVSDGKRDKHQTQQQDRIKRTVQKIYTVGQPHSTLTHSKTQSTTHNKLHNQILGNHNQIHAVPTANNLDDDNGKHISHRVVTTTLKLKHRTQVLLQIDILRTQQTEHRSRIRRRHRSSQKQTSKKRHLNAPAAPPRQQEDETTRQGSSQNNTQSRQNHTLSHNRTDVTELRIHTTRKKDDTQSHHTNKLSILHTVKLQAQPVTSEKHTNHKKQQESRNAKSIPSLTNQYTNQDQSRTNKQNILSSKIHNTISFK